jgi:hypothetical protein
VCPSSRSPALVCCRSGRVCSYGRAVCDRRRGPAVPEIAGSIPDDTAAWYGRPPKSTLGSCAKGRPSGPMADSARALHRFADRFPALLLGPSRQIQGRRCRPRCESALPHACPLHTYSVLIELEGAHNCCEALELRARLEALTQVERRLRWRPP